MSCHKNPGQGDKFYEMRLPMCVTYYVPMDMTGNIIHAVDNTTKKHVFKPPDVFLHAFAKYFGGLLLVIKEKRVLATHKK